MGIKDTQSDQPKSGYGFGNQAKLKGSPDKADTAGERHEKMRGGVAMGKMDKYGPDHQYNTGRTNGVCYTHERDSYMKE